MSDHSAPTVRVRVSMKQNAKGEFQRDYTVEVAGELRGVFDPDEEGRPPDLILLGPEDDCSPRDAYSLHELIGYGLRRAEAEHRAHITTISGDGGNG